MIVLILNALAYFLWFVNVYKKEKSLTLYSSLILLIFGVAFLGVVTVGNGIYFDVFGYYDLSLINFVPYLLCFIGFLIFFEPLRGIRISSLDISLFESNSFKIITYIWLFISTLFVGIRIFAAVVAVSIGLDVLYEATHIEGDPVDLLKGASDWVYKTIWIGSNISRATSPLMMLFSMFLLSKTKHNFLAYYILFLSVAPYLASAISIGSRGAMLWSLFRLVFIVVLTKDLLPKEKKKNIYMLLTYCLTVVLIYSIITTIGRFGDDNMFSSILRYFGEPFPNVSFLYWDNVTNHPFGDRLIPDLVGFTKDIGDSSEDVFMYWGSVTGVPILNWKVLYCDSYIEFGVWGGMLFLCIFSGVFKYLFIKYGVTIYTISILFFYYEQCDSSYTGFNAFSYVLIPTFITILITNIILYVIPKK